MAWVREIDQWFVDQVLPHGAAYARQARRWAPDAESARDIVQEAYARVITLNDWRSLSRPKAYVLTVIRNIAIDRLRQARLAPFDRRDDDALPGLADQTPDALTRIVDRERLAHVRAVFQSLPPQCRQCMELRKFEELTVREIGDRLGLSVSTVEKHLAKGVRLIMGAMRDYEAETAGRNDQGGEYVRGPQDAGRRLAGEAGVRNGSA